jgi:RND family efflux transporter MFP subunit
MEYTGRTDSKEAVDVIPEVTGVLVKINFKEGGTVTKDEVLYEIDPVPFKATLDKAKAELLNAKAGLALAESELLRARQGAASGAVTREALDQAAAKKDTATAAIASADAEIARAQFSYDKTQVKSPISGRIGRTLLTVGNLVTSNSTRLTRIVRTDPIYAYFDVDETTSLKYRDMVFKKKTIPNPRDEKLLKAWMKLKNEEKYDREGVVTFIDAEMNRASATRLLRAEFPNADGYISPGDSVRIRVEYGPSRKAIVIPEVAVGTMQRQKFVYVINEKDEAEFRPVELGETREGLQVIEKGLGTKDRIVVNGLLRVRPGVKVTPVAAPKQ